MNFLIGFCFSPSQSEFNSFLAFYLFVDMIAATSVLQQQAGDIRQNKINWQSYAQSQMITNEDYLCVSALDSDQRASYLKQNPAQCAKTFLNLLSHVSKDQTIQYILVMIDDLLQEDRSRVEVFLEYTLKRKESVWGPFLNLLNRQDGFIVNMSSRILAKLACWGHEQMPKADLHFYLQWLKDQLTAKVSTSSTATPICQMTTCSHRKQIGPISNSRHICAVNI